MPTQWKFPRGRGRTTILVIVGVLCVALLGAGTLALATDDPSDGSASAETVTSSESTTPTETPWKDHKETGTPTPTPTETREKKHKDKGEKKHKDKATPTATPTPTETREKKHEKVTPPPTETPTEPDVDQVDAVTKCPEDTGGGLVEVTNPNDETVTVKVTGPDGYDTTETVEAGAERTFDGGLEDGTYDVKTETTEDDVVGTQTVEVECPPPEEDVPTADDVQVTGECPVGADVGQIAITNENEQPIDVEVAGEEFSATRTVGPSQSESIDEIPEGEYEVRILTTDGEELDTRTVKIDCPPEEEEFQVTFFGCGNVELTGPDDLFPMEVTLVMYQSGEEEIIEEEETLEEGERPGSPGGQLIGIYTPKGDFYNTNYDFAEGNCGDAAGNNPADGEPGDPRDQFPDDSESSSEDGDGQGESNAGNGQNQSQGQSEARNG